jgi:ketosteroid isomerase-like protein
VGAGGVNRRQFVKISAIAAASAAWHSKGQTMDDKMRVIEDQQEKEVSTHQHRVETSHRGKMDQTSTNREFVKRHFEAVNRRDVQTVLGNMRPDLYDHELQGDHKNDLQEGAQRLQLLMKQVSDLIVDVRDVIADGDKVVVRAVWSGTDAVSQRKVEFHGFVQWRIVDGKFAERWATVTPIVEIPEGTNTLRW